jgi:hypothetical protein
MICDKITYTPIVFPALNKQSTWVSTYLEYAYIQNALWLLYPISISVHSLQTHIYCHEASHITDIMLHRHKSFFKIISNQLN